MKLVQINVSDYGSTGNIMISIQKAAETKGHTALSFCGRKTKEYESCIKISGSTDTYCHALLARLGRNGHGSKLATKKLIKKLNEIDPDIILLHNIHGYYINLRVFFKYLSNTKAKVFWTLHDCWAFTGGCAYFSATNCQKYKNGCGNCTVCKNEYPKTLIDTTSKEFKYKKSLIEACPDITFISPSIWLTELAKNSYLQNHKMHVINNGVDTTKFIKADDSTVKAVQEKYNIPSDKPIVLGVASVWDNRKSTQSFYRLAKKLQDYTVVMVGSGCVSQENTPNLVCISRTDSISEMAAIYSCATVFLNLSLEDNFPLVSLEALSCGIPVVSSNLCGSPEAISEDTGFVVSPLNDDEIISAINSIVGNPNLQSMQKNCRDRAVALYDCSVMNEKYINLLFN